MQLKTYIDRSVKAAMRQAKADLGDDVILLESRKVNDMYTPEGPMMEITVTTNQDDESGNVINDDNGNVQNADVFADFLTAATEARISSPVKLIDPFKSQVVQSKTNTEDTAGFQRSLKRLGTSLYDKTVGHLPEMYAEIFSRLCESGITTEHAAGFVRRAFLVNHHDNKITEDKALSSVRDEFMEFFKRNSTIRKHLISAGTYNTSMYSRSVTQVLALVGPTGVGKTSTIMKLALNPAAFGNQRVAIISADTYRLAASESLRAFCKITSVQFAEVKTPDELQDQVKKFRDVEVILVDMPGRSPSFPNYLNELKKFIDVLDPTDVFLTLSATSDVEDVHLASGAYLALNPTGLIFTKIDETGRVGKVVSMAKNVPIPVVYMTTGQTIPDDVVRSDGKMIWERIFPE